MCLARLRLTGSSPGGGRRCQARLCSRNGTDATCWFREIGIGLEAVAAHDNEARSDINSHRLARAPSLNRWRERAAL